MNSSKVLSYRFRCVLLLPTVFLLAFSASGRHNTSSEELEEGWISVRDAGIRTWQRRLLPEFRRAVDRKTRERIDELGFRVVRFADFNAFADYEKQEIVIPVGLIIMLHNLADAVIATWAKPQCVEHLKEYPSILVDFYFKGVRGEQKRMPDFAKVCKIAKSEIALIRKGSDRYSMKVSIIVDALALIVGHEIGHLVRNHKDSKSLSTADSQKQEYDADEFGLKLAADAGFLPLAGLATGFVLFALMESAGDAAGKGKHPPTACRMSRMFELSPDIATIQGGAEGVKRFRMTKEDFKQSVLALTKECDKHKKE